MNLPTVAMMLLGVAGGLLGAWLSTLVRAGSPWWLPLAGSVLVSLAWVGAVRTSTADLVVLSAWFDVLVVLAWFVGFWWLGKETISVVQWCGIALLCVGLALIDL